MEQLLHYVWKHKLFPLSALHTTDGQPLEVIDPGLHNPDAGPDFFNAKIKLDGTLWVGNVEIHERASDWFRHGHQHDAKYSSVILHVTEDDDAPVMRPDGTPLPTLRLQVPPRLSQGYEQLLRCDMYPPCYRLLPSLSPLLMHSWMSALSVERMMERAQHVDTRVKEYGGNWEDAFFATLARNFGFGINGDAFEMWARHVPLRAVDKHRDDLFQIMAIFFGQAGLLQDDEPWHGFLRDLNGGKAMSNYSDSDSEKENYSASDSAKAKEEASARALYLKLRKEYQYLAHKFELQPMDASRWNFLRLRPHNFPYPRIAQLARLYHRSYGLLSLVVEKDTVEELHRLFKVGTLSRQSLDLMVINTVVPFLYAYGRHKADERLTLRATRLLEAIRPENNYIIRMWDECGVHCAHAGDSQALIQLKKEYCDKKKCLYCRIGFHYLKGVSRDL